MANCVTKFFTKKGTAFTETRGVVIEVKISDKITWDFYSGNNFVAFDGGVPYIVGKWGCDGDENFTITGDVTKTDGTKKNQTFSSKTPDKWTDTVTDTPAQLDSEFSCITNGLTSMGKSFQIKDNMYVVADYQMTTGLHAIGQPEKPTIKWYFYKPKQGTRTWVEYDYNRQNITLQGTWSCSGESNFKLTRTDGKTYVGGDTSWKEDTQAEPTYDKSKFPLKVGIEGREVAQLQKYLNTLIPLEPLVVNGIFDKKTQDKLIQLQKNLPL
jgi:hypothetical protein